MTMVVSEVSKYGIVMVGDSAVTKRSSSGVTVAADAVKVQYCKEANVGFALWGNAGTGLARMDFWLDKFILDQIKQNDPIEDIGKKLVDSLNNELTKSSKPWSDLVRGIHLAGYRNKLPVLFHIHNGHENEPPHELRLYRDFPDDKGWSEEDYPSLLINNLYHLRNGYHPLFGRLFNATLDYAASLRKDLNITFPQNNLKGRFEFYKLLVGFIAGTLIASGLHQAVNDTFSAIAFDQTGIIIDERLSLVSSSYGTGSSSYEEIL